MWPWDCQRAEGQEQQQDDNWGQEFETNETQEFPRF